MSSAQKIAAAGNAMSVSVLLALFPPLLQAAGLDCLVQGGTRSDGNGPRDDREQQTRTVGCLPGSVLTRTVPETIENLQAPTILYLTSNGLTGTIPDTIGSMQTLTFWRKRGNSLTGTIPETIVNPQALMTLCLRDNSVTGMIPEAISFLHHTLRLKADWVPW